MVMFRFSPGLIEVAGAVGSGKTTFCLDLIKHRNSCFAIPPQEVIVYYECWQDFYLPYAGEAQFIEGMPNCDFIMSNNVPKLVLIDDLGDLTHSDKNFYRAASVMARHKNIYLVNVSHNVFKRDRYTKDINLAAQYLVLFNNRRYENQLGCLGRQCFGARSKQFVDAYKEAIKNYKYIVIDLTLHGEHELVSDVFNAEHGPAIYLDGKD